MYIYIFFILVGSIVFISTLIMTVWFKTNRVLNIYIIFTSVMLCLYLVLYGLKNINSYINLGTFWSINYGQIILILTPSVYLFLEKVIFDIKYSEKRDIFNFIIPFLFYRYLGTELYFENTIQKSIIFIVFIIYTLFYVYKSYCILNKYVWNTNVENLNSVVKNWIVFIFNMMVIVLLHFYISEFIYLWLRPDKIMNLVLEIALLIIFLIGYFKVITTPELLYGSSHLKKVSDTKEVSRLCINNIWKLELDKEISNDKDLILLTKIKDKIVDYIKDIEKVTVINNSFRASGYSIYDLSKELGLPKYYLEFIFKYYCKVTFNDYKKNVRIYDAIELINEGYLNSNKLDSLAKHIGFASYNPFLINFKEITGISPFEYNKTRKIHKTDYFHKK